MDSQGTEKWACKLKLSLLTEATSKDSGFCLVFHCWQHEFPTIATAKGKGSSTVLHGFHCLNPDVHFCSQFVVQNYGMAVLKSKEPDKSVCPGRRGAHVSEHE